MEEEKISLLSLLSQRKLNVNQKLEQFDEWKSKATDSSFKKVFIIQQKEAES